MGGDRGTFVFIVCLLMLGIVTGSSPIPSTTTHAPVSPPQISGYTNDTVLNDGDTVTVTCTQAGGFPLSNITWDCMGHSNDTQISGAQSTSSLTFNVDRAYNNKTCTCTDTYSDQKINYTKSQTVVFDVHYAPVPANKPTLSGYVNGNALEEELTVTRKLSCEQSDCNPLCTLTWDCEGLNGTTNNTQTEAISVIQVPLQRQYNGKACKCTATHNTSPAYTEHVSVVFTIHYPPDNPPQIGGYNTGTTLNDGETVTVTCTQEGGFPLSNITWDCMGHSNDTQKSEGQSTSSVTFSVDREYNNKTCTCTATHPDPNINYTKSQSVVFDVHYPPSSLPKIEGYNSTESLNDGDRVTITCTQAGGFPLSNIKWDCMGHSGYTEKSGGQSTSSVTFSVDREYNNKTCTCTATHPDQKINYIASQSVVFDVFSPDLSNATIDHIDCLPGSNLTIKLHMQDVPENFTNFHVLAFQVNGSDTVQCTATKHSSQDNELVYNLTGCVKDEDIDVYMVYSNEKTVIEYMIRGTEKHFLIRCNSIDEKGITKIVTFNPGMKDPTSTVKAATPLIQLSMEIEGDHPMLMTIGKKYNLIIKGPPSYSLYPQSCEASVNEDGSDGHFILEKGCSVTSDILEGFESYNNGSIHATMYGFRIVESSTFFLVCNIKVCPKHGCIDEKLKVPGNCSTTTTTSSTTTTTMSTTTTTTTTTTTSATPTEARRRRDIWKQQKRNLRNKRESKQPSNHVVTLLLNVQDEATRNIHDVSSSSSRDIPSVLCCVLSLIFGIKCCLWNTKAFN